ncbi:MAG: DUF945 family protein [Thioalkalivibrio sp.]|nr:MAG: DUF945 family protein [Thioalkalivibrio sp.]
MRKILIALLLVVVAAAAWPVYVGVQIENALEEPFTGYVGELRIHHAVSRYERERYRARATSVLHVVGQGLDFELELEHRIDHRLLGAAVQTRTAPVRADGEIPALWAAALAQARPRADSWLGLGGGVSSRLSSRPVLISGDADPEEEPIPFRLHLGAGQGGIAYAPERMVVSFDTARMDLTEGERRLLLEQLYFGLVVHPDPEGRYGPLPDYDIGLGSGLVSFTRGDREILALETLQMSSNQNSVANRLDSLWRVRAEELRSVGLAVETLDLQLTALRWHRPTLLQFMEDLEGVRAMALATDLQTGLLLGMVLEGLQRMIEHDPSLKGHLRLNSEPGKHVRLTADLGLSGEAEAFASRPLESIALNLDLEAGVSLLEEVAALLQAEAGLEATGGMDLQSWLELAVDEEWAQVENGVLSSQLRMEDGRLLINGRDQTVLLLALVFGLARGMF